MLLRYRFGMTLLLATCSAGPALAEDVTDFYRGKTVNIIVGTSAGKDYDLRAACAFTSFG